MSLGHKLSVTDTALALVEAAHAAGRWAAAFREFGRGRQGREALAALVARDLEWLERGGTTTALMDMCAADAARGDWRSWGEYAHDVGCAAREAVRKGATK